MVRAATAFTEVKGHFQSALDRLRALEPPEEDAAALEEDAAALEEAYAGVEELIGLLDEMIAASEAGDQATLEQLLEEGEPIEERVNQQLTEVGLDVCAED